MKILVICHRFPYPPRQGGNIRSFNMIRHLGASHDVVVASLARSDVEAEEGKGIASYCTRYEMVKVNRAVQLARMVARIPTPEPSSFGYFHSQELRRRIQALLAEERFDLIIAHSSSVAPYVRGVQGIPKILDFCDMDSQKWLAYARFKPVPLNLGFHLEGTKLVSEERRLASLFDTCTTATRGELETLESYGVPVDADWFPNGVDAEYFRPSAERYDPNVISFVGRMDYFPNERCVIDFCCNVLPRIRERCAAAQFLIVGASPTAAVRKLGEQPGVTVTGWVPDVRPYLLRSAAMIASLDIARGTQNKLLEAMASGVPVVTSSAAAKGIDAVASRDFLVGDSAQEIGAATVELLKNPARRAELAAAGRARVLAHHSWDEAMRRFDAIIERCVGESKSGDDVHDPAIASESKPLEVA